MSAPAVSPASPAVPDAPRGGSTAVVPWKLAWLLSRPGKSGGGTAVLPMVAFGLVTTLLLTVLAGVLSFLRWQDELAFLYQLLAVLALILLVFPLLTLGGSAALLSARRRDDRLATLRLLGATPATVAGITIIESTALAAAGAVAGVAGYLVLGPAVQLIPFRGEPIGGAYWLGPLAVLAVVAGVVLLAAISAAVGLRKVVISPLGVRTCQAPAKMHWLRALLAAVVVLAGFFAMNAGYASTAVAVACVLGAFAAGLAVLNLVGPWAVAVMGRRQLRKAATAEKLLAARSILEFPKAAWRQVSGLAMTSFVAVFGGTGVAMTDGAPGPVSGPEQFLSGDIRTGILITIVVSFVMVACSAGVNQAAAVLDRADLYTSLDRLGMPRITMDAARTRAVMLPLVLVSLGSAAVSFVLIFPLAGMALVLAPLSILTIVGCLGAGILLVWAGLRTTRPVLGKVLAAGG
ncbi:permease [Arthrobacter sp. NPDC089319]|uniref:permease n=1 Tax=Arthrobacter sp. NPDC089319 TaxID=3155915 RepID=UPI0034183B79